jgi:PAS domain S-box-containing protein
VDRRHADLIRLSPDAILVVREDRIEVANQAAAQLFGEPSPAALLGRSALEWIDPADQPATRGRVGLLLAGGAIDQRHTITVVRRDGSTRRVETMAAAFEEAGGRSIQVVLHDVTAREQYERELSGFNRRLSDLVESITDAFYAVGPDWRLSYVNRRTEELWRKPREALVGQVLWDLFGSQVAPAAVEALHRSMRERAPAHVEIYSEYLQTWVETSVYPAADGGLSVFFRDISERKRAERRLRLLAESLPQLVWTADGDGRLEWFNQRWRDYTGQRQGEEAWLPALHPDDREAVLQRWGAATTQLIEFEMEHRLRRADGEYRWFLRRAFPLLDETGRATQWFGTCTDVDDLKVSQDLLRKAAKLREDFLSMAAHEFRTPLTALRLQLDLLRRSLQRPGGGAERVEHRLSVVQVQADRLKALVGTLLDVSRMEAGRFVLEPSPFDLADLAREVAERLRPEAEASGIELRLHAAPVPGSWDQVRLDQVLTNLLGNAIKYSDRRPVEVEVGRGGEEAVIIVRDRGIGVAPELFPHLFERFERGENARQYNGLGLGLWIARLLVEAHGGRISAESALGQGSTFTVRLPLSP